jgi:hypothetical protein
MSHELPELFARLAATFNGTAAGQQREAVIDQLTAKAERSYSSSGSSALCVKRLTEDFTCMLGQHTTETLTAIKNAFPDGDGLNEFVYAADAMDNQKDIRVAAHYKSTRLHRNFSIHLILKHVRSSLRIKNLTRYPEGTPEYDAVLAVITVAINAVKTQHYLHHEAARSFEAKGHLWRKAEQLAKEQLETDGAYLSMTPKLARVITQHPDRADDISDYLRDNTLAPSQVDTELLLMRLTTEATALSDGLL